MEFFRVTEGENEKTTITVAKPLEDGGFTDQNSFTVDESRHGFILKDNPNDRFLYRTVHMIPVIDENGKPVELSVRFSVCPTGSATIISIIKHELGGDVIAILHEKAVLHNDFLCDTVTRSIEKDTPINWVTGVFFKQCHISCSSLTETRCIKKD